MNASRWPDGIARTVVYPHDVSALRSSVLGLAVRGLLTNRAASVSGDTDTQSALTYPAPAPWRRTNLGNIIKLVSGQHLLPTEYNTDPNGGGIPYVTGPSDFGRTGLIIERYALVRKAVATEGQLLLTVKGSGVGSTAWCDQPCVAISRQLMALEATGCTPEFLELLVYEMAAYLKERARSLIPGISRNDVLGFMVAVPAEDEQHEIIAKVREVTALCDELEVSQTKRDNTCDRLRSASLSRLTAQTETPGTVAEKDISFFLSHSSRMVTRPAHVADVRRAILDLATYGSLSVPSARPPQMNNRGRCTDARPSMPAGWRWFDLSEAITTMEAGWSPQCENHARDRDDQWAVLRTTSVQTLLFNPAENKQLPANLDPRPSLQVQAGDILITRAGPIQRVAICCVVDRPEPCLMISDKLIRFHMTAEFDPRFVAICLNAGHSKARLEEAKSGMAVMQMNISQDRLRKIPIAAPSLEEQRWIVAKVDELMAVCAELEQSLETLETGRTRALEAILHGVLEEAGAPLPVLLEVAR
jgi:type I restriction enzyme, S subunit